jgi:hypothetical protein
MSHTNESVCGRVHKNCVAIRQLMNELHEKLGMYHMQIHSERLQKDLNWGDVGDLAHIRKCLNEALGHEDKDPEG